MLNYVTQVYDDILRIFDLYFDFIDIPIHFYSTNRDFFLQLVSEQYFIIAS